MNKVDIDALSFYSYLFGIALKAYCSVLQELIFSFPTLMHFHCDSKSLKTVQNPKSRHKFTAHQCMLTLKNNPSCLSSNDSEQDGSGVLVGLRLWGDEETQLHTSIDAGWHWRKNLFFPIWWLRARWFCSLSGTGTNGWGHTIPHICQF